MLKCLLTIMKLMRTTGSAWLRIRFQAADKEKNTSLKAIKMNKKAKKSDYWQKDL